MTDFDDFERLRARLAGNPAWSPSGRGRARGRDSFVGVVVSTGSNLGVGKFALVHPVAVLGAESEGSAATLDEGSTPIPVYMAGPAAPETGDYLVCRYAPYRWVAEKPGAASINAVACCGGNAPNLINLDYSYTGPPSFMDEGIVFSDSTLTLGAIPAGTPPLNSSPNWWYSPDPGAGGASFYVLTCGGGTPTTAGFTLWKMYRSSSGTYTGGPGATVAAGQVGKVGSWSFSPSDAFNHCSPFLGARNTWSTSLPSGYSAYINYANFAISG